MEKLINTLPAILKAAEGSEEVAAAACVAAWKHVVGEALSSHALPVKLQDKTLTIAVADAIWQKQLEQLRGQLLFRLNALLGQATVKSIELSVQPGKFQVSRAAQKTGENMYAGAVPIELVSAAAGIQDLTLRRAFLGAAVSCINRLENTTPSSDF